MNKKALYLNCVSGSIICCNASEGELKWDAIEEIKRDNSSLYHIYISLVVVVSGGHFYAITEDTSL